MGGIKPSGEYAGAKRVGELEPPPLRRSEPCTGQSVSLRQQPRAFYAATPSSSCRCPTPDQLFRTRHQVTPVPQAPRRLTRSHYLSLAPRLGVGRSVEEALRLYGRDPRRDSPPLHTPTAQHRPPDTAGTPPTPRPPDAPSVDQPTPSPGHRGISQLPAEGPGRPRPGLCRPTRRFSSSGSASDAETPAPGGMMAA